MNDRSTAELVISLITTIIVVLISPILGFIFGAILGLILKITIGNMVVVGLSYLGLTIPVVKLPLICGSIATLGSIFHCFCGGKSSKSK